MITETVYNGRDNINSLELRANGVAQDISGATRLTLKVRDRLLDSAKDATIFDWTTSGSSGQLDIVLGHQRLKVGTCRATLTVFDATYPNGLNWGDFMLTVKEG